MARALPALVGIIAVIIVAPGVAPLIAVARGIAHEGVAPLFVSTDRITPGLLSLAFAAAIALLACAIAFPLAWFTRGSSARFLTLAAGPLLFPPYLAYSGLSQLIAPGTAIGDILASGPSSGPNWWPAFASRGIALIGLALWAWPVAFFPLALATRSLDSAILDSRRLDPGSRVRRMIFIIATMRRPLAFAFILITCLMLGSAIPLHLAQAPTYTVRLWADLTLVNEGEVWRVWARSWPVLLPALFGAAIVHRRLTSASLQQFEGIARPNRTVPRVYLAMVIGASVVLPAMLLAQPIRSLDAFPRFLRLNLDAVRSSLLVASVVGLVGTVIALSAWACRAWAGHSRLATMASVSLIALALVPGVLTGRAVASASLVLPHAFADGILPVVLAQLARLAFIPLLAGWFIASASPPHLDDLRRIDGADSFRGFCIGDARVLLGPAVALAIALACLSLHEVEATIMVQPPGAGSLARRVLELLHYQRMEDLGVAVLWMLLPALIGASALLLTAGKSSRRPNCTPPVSRIMPR